MATGQLGTVLRHIRSLTVDAMTGEHTDAVLLRAFVSRNDHTAFEALVRRHGPMILRVCQRTLGDCHDAEDALQATFLVLARQAAAIRRPTSLASWLHGVAYRTALQARKAACRRHKHEANAALPQPTDPALSAAWRELAALLDGEIQLLPEILRTPFTLCCLENRSCAETARLLGIRDSAVAMRLSRARQRLRERLARRGVSLTAVLAACALGANDAIALPAQLAAATAQGSSPAARNCSIPETQHATWFRQRHPAGSHPGGSPRLRGRRGVRLRGTDVLAARRCRPPLCRRDASGRDQPRRRAGWPCA